MTIVWMGLRQIEGRGNRCIGCRASRHVPAWASFVSRCSVVWRDVGGGRRRWRVICLHLCCVMYLWCGRNECVNEWRRNVKMKDDNRLRNHEYEMEYTKKIRQRGFLLLIMYSIQRPIWLSFCGKNSLILPADIIWRGMNENVRNIIKCLWSCACDMNYNLFQERDFHYTSTYLQSKAPNA